MPSPEAWGSCMPRMSDVLEISKQTFKRKLSNDFCDRDGFDVEAARELLARPGQEYTLPELKLLSMFLISGHDCCVDENSHDYSVIEVWTARRNIDRATRVAERLKGLDNGLGPVYH